MRKGRLSWVEGGEGKDFVRIELHRTASLFSLITGSHSRASHGGSKGGNDEKDRNIPRGNRTDHLGVSRNGATLLVVKDDRTIGAWDCMQ